MAATVLAIPFVEFLVRVFAEFARLDVDAAALGTLAVQVLVVDSVGRPRHNPSESLLGLFLGNLERPLGGR